MDNDDHGGCIPDEYASLVREIRVESGLVGTHKYHLKSYREVLVGRELVQWLGKKKGMSESRGRGSRGRGMRGKRGLSGNKRRVVWLVSIVK